MAEKLAEFDYLLNRLELASQSDNPAASNYNMHRKALYAHVRALEAKAAQPDHAALLRQTLERIVAIKNEDWGGDWDEIEEAREIARSALATTPEASNE